MGIEATGWKCLGEFFDLPGEFRRELARISIRAADAYDAAARLAAGPQPTRERDTDAWWAD